MAGMTNRLLRAVAIVCAGAILVGGVVQAQTATPTQAFTEYRKTLATAKTYSEILPFMDAKGRSFIEPMPAETQAKMFDLLKRFGVTYTDVAVTKETITGDTAMLELSGKDPKGQAGTGTVPMTKEASGWKVGTEKWSSKPR